MKQPVQSQVTEQLDQLKNGSSVPDGWDVALHLSESAVQKLVQHNWDANTHARDERPISLITPEQTEGQHDVIEVQSNLCAPAVSLDQTTQAATLAFVLDQGTFRTGKVAAEIVAKVRDALAVHQNGSVDWSKSISLSKQNPLHLRSQLPIRSNATPTASGFSVDLAMAEANIALEGRHFGGRVIQGIHSEVASWLAAQKLDGRIASLATQSTCKSHALTPASFASQVIPTTGGSSVLRLLASSTASAAVPVGDSIPVPHPDGQDFSLMVSSKATTAMIASGYNAGTGAIKLDHLPPQSGDPHWFLQVHEPMVFNGVFGVDGGETYQTDQSSLYMRFGGSTYEGLKLYTYIDPESTIQLELELAAHYPLAVSGTAQEQLVGLSEGAQSVVSNGFYENIVQPQLEAFLTGDIKADMTRVSLQAVSDLVLRDLSLAGHLLNFETSALPGELMIAGSLTSHN